MSQVAAKKKLALRNETVKVVARFREEGSVLGGTQRGICEDLSVELSIDGEESVEQITELLRLAHGMCFTENALTRAVPMTTSHLYNGLPIVVVA